MKAKWFQVAQPGQLKEIEPFITDGSAESIIRVWSFYQASGKGKIWNDAIFVTFSGGKKRKAALVKSIYGDVRAFASLKYNTALHWCQRNLREVCN